MNADMLTCEDALERMSQALDGPLPLEERQALEELIPAYNREKGANVFFVNGSEWIPPEPLHPLRDGHRIVAEHLTPILREIFRLPESGK